MKNKLLQIGVVLLVIVLNSCQKDIRETNKTAADVLIKAGNNANVEKSCRLLVDKGLSDGFIQSYHYNDKGLADEFQLFKPGEYDMWATMAYGERNEITSAKFYYDAATYYDIIFEYEKDKIVKETWYEPGTNIPFDGYINSYNTQGQLVKRDEPIYELYSLFHYDVAHNVTKIEIFDYAGNLYYGVDLTYSRPVKNPFTSVTGLPESIFFTDAIESPNRFTGLRYYFNDDQGNEVAFVEWKSDETELVAGAQNYAVYQNSRDDINGIWTDQTWTYENCTGNSEAAHSSHAVSQAKANPFKQLSHARKTSHYKQDLLAWKKAFLDQNN
ncbi:MAG: hypothetical protein V4717_07405 [Bacteroidota bacterium]